MTDLQISKDILQRIKKEKIKPRSKWQFFAKDCMIWAVGGLSLIMGGLSIAVILHILQNNDWDIYNYMHMGILGFFFSILPYVWLAILIVFIIIADYNFRRTSKGYRIRLIFIVGGSIFISIGLGLFWYKIGLGQFMEHLVVERVPAYTQVVPSRYNTWSHPERGFLAGIITIVNNDSQFELQDSSEIIWKIIATQALREDGVQIKQGRLLRVVGKKTGPNVFTAVHLLPWIPEHQFLQIFSPSRESIEKNERIFFQVRINQ